MSIADTLTTAAEAYLEKLSDVVKKPDFSITLGGVVLTELADRITSLSVTDNNGFDADQLTLSVDDSDGVTDLPPRGAELAVSIGWLGEALIYKGLYTVDEVGHSGPPDVIDITAHSADFREEMNVRREVSWHDVTVERVVSAIARRYDLTPMISEALIDIEIDHADQTEESDMSFLTRMAEMLGAIATVKNGCLLFIQPGGGVSASGRALPSAEITRASGDRHRFRIADRDAYTGVRAYWLDLNFGKKKPVKVTKRKTNTARKKTEEKSSRPAAAKWIQLQKGAAQFSITLARGRADLYPGMHLNVSGFKPEIDTQDWIIARAEHVIGDTGFTTQMELEAKISDWIAETEQ
ncbi:phage late control D family protein [Klebsiella oxytoca]|uniref:contractile injection system protein, VgrG/Pvc8 family n=1 Tax=Klebsiella oxytoca TaxID=571 RepID=UPI001CCE6C94|nr:contractile injection system protein, VgrG/Pvc8 family [Klebsiella oxytoca]MBZ7263999.1 phage late control D family protein [Klebsiella oxytoca]